MERILVVDDTPEFRKTVARALKFHGYEVSEAENSRVAMDLINEFNPELILLDVTMPEMDGITFLSKLSAFKAFDATPVILLSGLVIQDSLAMAANARIVDCLVKAQFSLEELLDKVRCILDALLTWQLRTLRNDRGSTCSIGQATDSLSLSICPSIINRRNSLPSPNTWLFSLVSLANQQFLVNPS